jgi:hypothetical protein
VFGLIQGWTLEKWDATPHFTVAHVGLFLTALPFHLPRAGQHPVLLLNDAIPVSQVIHGLLTRAPRK